MMDYSPPHGGNTTQNHTQQTLMHTQYDGGTQHTPQHFAPMDATPRSTHGTTTATPTTRLSARRGTGGGGGGGVGSTTSSASKADRFIPTQLAGGFDSASAQFNITDNVDRLRQHALHADQLAYQNHVARAVGVALDQRILAFAPDAPAPRRNDIITAAWNRPLRAPGAAGTVGAMRRIRTDPAKILDAPGLSDDFYLNVLAWSCRNILAVALAAGVFLWNGDSGETLLLCPPRAEDAFVSALQWAPDGSHLTVALATGDVEVWSVETRHKIRTMRGRAVRVGAIAWDLALLSTGARDGSIWHHDVRIAQHRCAELLRHEGDVCGLRWRPDGQHLASGGNDNLVCVWDVRSTMPRMVRTEHTAAVKALAWCPWQLNTLTSGGGTHDRHVHFWNTATNTCLASIDTESQVTAIEWSLEYKELLTCHGYPNNHIAIWKYPSLTRIGDLPGHDQRILHAALSPDGQVLATGAADENLKFWTVWESRRAKKQLDDMVRARSGGVVGADPYAAPAAEAVRFR